MDEKITATKISDYESKTSIGVAVGLSMMIVSMILMSAIVITFDPLSIESLMLSANLALIAWGFAVIGALILRG